MAKNKTCSLNLVFFPTPLNRVSPTTDWTFLSCIFHSTQFLVTTGLNVFQKGSIRFKIHAGKNIFCIAHCRFAVGVNGGPAGEGLLRLPHPLQSPLPSCVIRGGSIVGSPTPLSRPPGPSWGQQRSEARKQMTKSQALLVSRALTFLTDAAGKTFLHGRLPFVVDA